MDIVSRIMSYPTRCMKLNMGTTGILGALGAKSQFKDGFQVHFHHYYLKKVDFSHVKSLDFKLLAGCGRCRCRLDDDSQSF